MNQADKRLEYLKILAKDYTFEYFPKKIEIDDKSLRINTEKANQPYLVENEKGNMEIYYPCILDKAGIIYHRNKKSFDIFKRTRHTQPKEGMPRYTQPKETGINIFIPKNTLNKVRAKEQIETLYMIEGEIKAIYGDWFGVDIVGVGGIHMIKQSKRLKEFHPTIKKILKDCKVKNVVFITDADSTEVKFDFDKKPDKDYSERLNNFHSAIKYLKICFQRYNEEIKHVNLLKSENNPPLKKCYWSMISEKFNKAAKGLDDLICYQKAEAGIIEDLKKLNDCKTYFSCIDLEEASNDYLLKTFFLDVNKEGLPQNFYNVFEREIEDRKFWFDNCQFKYSDEKRKLEFIFHKDLKEYFRVGIDYYREVINRKPILNKASEQILIEKRGIKTWSKPEIKQDYEQAKGIKQVFNYIPKYTGFCNIPAHDTEYSRIVENEYNLYHPTPYAPEKGSFPNIEKFMKHLFQNKYHDKLDIAYDILQLKYINPLVKLPIMVLYSKEKNTGKSTFLNLLNWIYEDNAALIGNKELADNFTEYMACNALLMDEVYLENLKTVEMIKSWSTQSETSMNKKGKDRIKVPFFATMFMTTNRINFASIDEDENRFFVIKVPTIPIVELDPYLEQKMVEEIPALLYWLKHERKLTYPTKKSRFWFPFKDLETPTLTELKKQSQTHAHQAMVMHVKQHCFDFSITEYETTPSILRDELRKFTKYELSSIDIAKLLKNDFNLEPQTIKRFRYWQWKQSMQTGQELEKYESPTYFDVIDKKIKYYLGATYTIRAEHFLTPEEVEQLHQHITNPIKEHIDKAEMPF